MLSSMLFRCDAKLQAAARNHTFHITRGAHGLHVSRIQLALLLLSFKVVDDREWRFGLYGESTAAAVLAYKRSRQIVNRAYQQQADDIVGVMTILQLDKELNVLASCLPARSYRPPTSGIRDSAAHFELCRCIALLRQQASLIEPWSDTIMAGRGVRHQLQFDAPLTVAKKVVAFTESAAEFSAMLQAMNKGVMVGGVMMGPQKEGLRDDICKVAAGEMQWLTFAGVARCWDVVEPLPMKDGQPGPKTKAPNPMDYQWCGIYVADIWRRAGLEDVTWSLEQKRSGINKTKKSPPKSHNLQMLAPGDILIDARLINMNDPNTGEKKKIHANHHMLILAISRDRTKASILQGNSGGKPARESVVTRVDLSLIGMTRERYSFISVDTLRDPGLTYP